MAVSTLAAAAVNRRRWLGLFLLATLCAAAPAPAATRLAVIVGLGGEARFEQLFHRWANTLLTAARDRYGVPEQNLYYWSSSAPPADAKGDKETDGDADGDGNVENSEAENSAAGNSEAESGETESAVDTAVAEDVGQSAGTNDTDAAAVAMRRPDRPADAEAIAAALAELAAVSRDDDQTLIVLIGHGSARNGQALFHIRGPDLSAQRFAELLEPVKGRLALVNAASASGPFVAALAAPRRVVISATQNAMERFNTMFGQFFIDAFAGDGADVDKNRRLSLLEAFDYAQREVERFYQAERRLRTEHALLDDNGDGEGSRAPSQNGDGDGALAAAWTLRLAAADAGLDPQLLDQRQRLERELETLREEKDNLDEADYQTRLEDLLIELALINRRLKQAAPESAQ